MQSTLLLLGILLFSTLEFAACKKETVSDPCAETYCLNGGDCLDGTCICPSGFSGANCEIEDTSGFSCSNGTCIQVSSGAQYNSLSQCQQACQSGGNTSGYNCVNGNCQQVSSNAQYSSLSACQNSCSAPQTSYNCVSGNCQQVNGTGGQFATLSACQSNCSSNTQTTLRYINNSSTRMDITLNGVSRTIPPGSSQSFTGTAGTLATGFAQTSGQTAQGQTVGQIMEWNLSNTFPASGTFSVNLNVGSNYFFLRIRNQGSRNLSGLTVNFGLTTETFDNINIPNDGQVYDIGYYRAWTNTQVRATLQGTTFYTFWDQGVHFTLPFTQNQSTLLLNTNATEPDIPEEG